MGTETAVRVDREAGSGTAATRLRADGISVRFGGLNALADVHVELVPPAILGLIGPNGAGKTTLVNVLSGFQRPTRGSVWIGDADATRWSAQRRAQCGVVRTFQDVRLFAGLTVEENVALGAVACGARPHAARLRAQRLLDRAGLSPRAEVEAASLPHGEERQVGVLRALSAEPSIVLLDEPAAGLTSQETADLRSFLADVRDEVGCGFLLIEHDMDIVMQLCDTVQVLDYGKTIAKGPPDEVRRDPKVIEAYLGVPK